MPETQQANQYWANSGPKLAPMLAQYWLPTLVQAIYDHLRFNGPVLASQNWTITGPHLVHKLLASSSPQMAQCWSITGKPVLDHKWTAAGP